MGSPAAHCDPAALTTMLRSLVQKMLSTIDDWYFRRHRLQTLGPVLHVGRTRYRGPDRVFPDGTSLRQSEPIGRLHFNNASIAALGEGSLHRTGLRFARLMKLSLGKLAECAKSDPGFIDVRVFEGTSWIPEHGGVVGFVSQPLPRGVRAVLLSAHFKLLLWAFAPAAQTRANAQVAPRLYWITRAALTQNLGKLVDRNTVTRTVTREVVQ